MILPTSGTLPIVSHYVCVNFHSIVLGVMLLLHVYPYGSSSMFKHEITQDDDSGGLLLVHTLVLILVILPSTHHIQPRMRVSTAWLYSTSLT